MAMAAPSAPFTRLQRGFFANGARYTAEFAWRRRRNWLPIFFLYATFYMCRNNMNVAKSFVGFEHGWTKAMVGDLAGMWAIAYAIGQFVNGQLADRFGGRNMMALGALLTGAANLVFGFVAPVGGLTACVVIWALSGYAQSMGAPALVKINSQWFGIAERGVFTGLFGICTQVGTAVGLSLTGFIVAAMHWRWAFFVPAVVCLAYGAIMLLYVRDRPESVGFPSVDAGDGDCGDSHAPNFGYTLRKVFTSRPILLVALGYFCLGIVRHGLFIWYPDYLREVHHIATDSATFQVVSVLIPVAGVAGALSAGFLSDVFFAARRAPVGVIMYLGQAVLLVVFWLVAGPVVSGVLFVFLSFFIAGPHSLLGTAASMDFGGRKAAASAAGIIDAFQYVGMFIISSAGGRIIQAWGWNGWIATLIAASLIGVALLMFIWNARPGSAPAPAVATPGAAGSQP